MVRALKLTIAQGATVFGYEVSGAGVVMVLRVRVPSFGTRVLSGL